MIKVLIDIYQKV